MRYSFIKLKIAIILFAGIVSYAQNATAQKDTIRIFQYNLLNYGGTSNPLSYKDPRLSTIISYAEPDIVGANEIASGSSNSQNILTNVLGTQWSKGSYVNTNNEIQTNMLFWRTEKFGLKEQKTISHNLRDIIAFTLYYKDVNLAQTHDTVFLTIIVAHLKAGSTTQDETDRAAETQTVVNYLNQQNKSGNYIFMGDMNVYSSTEACYSNLINSTNSKSKFYDPINRPGAWNANSPFSDIHTQSTRTTALSDGGVTGGLDDRFDQMLVSGDIINNTSHVQYLANSYKAIGQDGNHFNKAVNATPTNSSAPASVIQSLYEMSDHLPIRADFIVNPPQLPVNSITGIANDIPEMIISNPFTDKIIIRSMNHSNEIFHCALYNMMGRIITEQDIQFSGNENDYLPVNKELPEGLYFLKIVSKDGFHTVYKLMKQH